MNNRMRFILAAVCLIPFGGAISAQAPAPEQAGARMDPAAMVDLAKRVQPALVRVEWTLKYDRSEPPQVEGMWAHSGNVIDEERPYEAAGYLVGPALVMTDDLAVHPRFVEKIEVRFGEHVVAARPAGYLVDQPGVLLQIAEPIPGTKPLMFVERGDGPTFIVNYMGGVSWDVNIAPMWPSSTVAVASDFNRTMMSVPGPLVVNAKGEAIALNFVDWMPLDASWHGSPLAREQVSSAELTAQLDELRKSVDRSLLRVTVNFRSPKAQNDGMGGGMYYGREPMDSPTEWNGVGLLIEPDRMLVLAKLKPSVTARLERIRIAAADGSTINASFVGSLKNYGAFIAKLEQPISGGGVKPAEDSIVTFRDELLLAAEVRVQGESREVFSQHERIADFHLGWNRQIHPDVAPEFPTFLYSLDGRLIAAPISRREKVTVDDGWGWRSTTLLASADLARALERGEAAFDPNNVPLSEEEESRLAWLGVETQALDTDLARALGVANLTNDGNTGGMVTFVYPDSPASRSGLAVGDVLIRLHVEGQPRPLEVVTEGDRWAYQGGFPWDRWDDLPEEYFDQIPTPWPSVESMFIRALTDLGFGTNYTAEVFRDGKMLTLEFIVEQSPPHYDSAPKFEAAPLGITVKDLTYEVRRYFQRPEGEPGVVISKVEPGSKASIAGIKPYEVITHINDQPVQTVKEFEERLQGLADLRLAVKRMTKGRIVRLTVDQPIGGGADGDAGAGDDANAGAETGAGGGEGGGR